MFSVRSYYKQLISASLLVAQWLECWYTNLVAQVRFLACLVQSQLLQESDHATATYYSFVNYILIAILITRFWKVSPTCTPSAR